MCSNGNSGVSYEHFKLSNVVAYESRYKETNKRVQQSERESERESAAHNT